MSAVLVHHNEFVGNPQRLRRIELIFIFKIHQVLPIRRPPRHVTRNEMFADEMRLRPFEKGTRPLPLNVNDVNLPAVHADVFISDMPAIRRPIRRRGESSLPHRFRELSQLPTRNLHDVNLCIATAAALEGNVVSIGCPGRLSIRGMVREVPFIAAIRIHEEDIGMLFAKLSHKKDTAAIRRPARASFRQWRIGEFGNIAAIIVHHVDVAVSITVRVENNRGEGIHRGEHHENEYEERRGSHPCCLASVS